VRAAPPRSRRRRRPRCRCRSAAPSASPADPARSRPSSARHRAARDRHRSENHRSHGRETEESGRTARGQVEPDRRLAQARPSGPFQPCLPTRSDGKAAARVHSPGPSATMNTATARAPELIAVRRPHAIRRPSSGSAAHSACLCNSTALQTNVVNQRTKIMVASCAPVRKGASYEPLHGRQNDSGLTLKDLPYLHRRHIRRVVGSRQFVAEWRRDARHRRKLGHV